MGRKFVDLVGLKFGKLTVIERAGSNKRREVMWLCQCECGRQAVVSGYSLRQGNSKSCGCLRSELAAIQMAKNRKIHGQSHSRLYHIWHNMKTRCNNPNHIHYFHYGGRGIKVCSEWENSFEAFRDWALANGYNDTLTIDRVDVNGNYEPKNCRWVTRKEQGYNKRSNRLVTYNGNTQTVTEWAKELGINRHMLRDRLSRGWSVEDALTTPPGGKRKK